jgi:hypothetical protein
MCRQNFGDELTNKKTSSYENGSTNASFLSSSTERMHLQEVLKMSSMRLNMCLGMSYHGPLNLFKDPGIVVDSLAGIQNVLVKCLQVVNRS